MRLAQTIAQSYACTLLCAVLASTAPATLARAHHAFAAEFAVEKPVALRGIVTKVELINPHSWIHIEVADAAGAKTVWMIEGGSPNALFKKGVTKNTIPIGSELVVDGYQARDGSHKAVGRNLSFADGRPLFFVGTAVPGGEAAQ